MHKTRIFSNHGDRLESLADIPSKPPLKRQEKENCVETARSWSSKSLKIIILVTECDYHQFDK